MQFCKLHGPMYPTLVSHIYFHVPTCCFSNLVYFGIGLKRLSPMLVKSTRAIVEFCNLQKKQMLRTSPREHPPSQTPKSMRVRKMKARKRGGYVNEDGQLTRRLALRVPMDTRWSSL